MNDRIPRTQRDHVLADVKATPFGWPTASLDPDSGARSPGDERHTGPRGSTIFRPLRNQGIAATPSASNF